MSAANPNGRWGVALERVGLDVAWDPAKAQANLAKHGVSFAGRYRVLDPLIAQPARGAWFTLGTASNGKLLAVSHIYQASSPLEMKVRIISAREASRRGRQQYEDELREEKTQ